jgi:NitT/TauT family transport system permease protein
VSWDDSLTYYLSTPSAVAAFLGESLTSAQFWSNFLSTMQATLISFGIGSAAGIVAGIAVSLMPRLESALDPYASALNSLPRIALAPVFIAFLGLGLAGKVAVGVSLVFFVLFYNCRAGVKSIDQDHQMLARALNFSKMQMFQKLLLPVAWPSIFAGLRLGFTYALLGVVSSEVVASRAGLGQLIMFYSAQFRMDAVYGTLIWMGLVSGGIYWLTGLAEKRLLSWKG